VRHLLSEAGGVVQGKETVDRATSRVQSSRFAFDSSAVVDPSERRPGDPTATDAGDIDPKAGNQ
jgi:hypothetical protein